MRAMVLQAPAPIEEAPLRLEEVEKPAPRAGEVLVRVLACGVCRTDLHTVEGDLSLPKLPLVPGHQVVGIVEQLGEGVSGLSLGQRVGIPWLHWACGQCSFCRRRQENLCPEAQFTGLHVDGGYAECVLGCEDFVYPISATLSPVEATPLLCGGVIGYRAFRLSGVAPEERLGIWGFGSSAHIVLQVARFLDCEVYVFTRGEQHRALAEQLGAAWVGRPDDEPPGPVDGGIIFAPAGELVPLALKALRKGGTLALAGIYMTPIPQMCYDLLYQERALKSVANSTRQDVRDFLQIAAAAGIRTTTQVYRLEEANQALLDLKQGRLSASAVLDLSSP